VTARRLGGRAVGLWLLAGFALSLVWLVFAAAPARASSGNWCWNRSLTLTGDCYSSSESNLYAIQAWSDDSLTWAWLTNSSASPSSKSGFCSSEGCTESLHLSTGGNGYQELAPYEEPLVDPDVFFGTWNS
jgi:hypothetical protein